MKRAVRWIGTGIVAAAAATMLLADVALAAPAAAGHGPGGNTSGRPDGPQAMTMVEIGQWIEYQFKTSVPLD